MGSINRILLHQTISSIDKCNVFPLVLYLNPVPIFIGTKMVRLVMKFNKIPVW